ncbi:MAG: lipid-binding SYLF domain-containing protein [Bryobacterales bacterium]|nr:lipid-binding SYLF domain-containing protein [Bryobacterales bacterium]
MIRKLGLFGLAMLSATFLMADESRIDVIGRIDQSARVLNEIMAAPDKGIPRDILEKAVCVGVIPGMKRAGFIVGARYGKGVLTCRTAHGWSGPSTIRIEGGSFGAQIGAGESDVVLVVMNRDGANRLMQSKFTIGGGAAAMAGPVGRSISANTDAYLTAEILTYARSRGLFAGVALDGATLRPDDSDNAILYGHNVSSEAILRGRVPRPAAAHQLYAALSPYVQHVQHRGEAARANPRTHSAGQHLLSNETARHLPAEHDSLTLTNGRQIRGRVISTTASGVRFRSDDGKIRVYPRSEVARLDFDR